MATPSYRERMKAARAQARAQREAERSAQLREIELRVEVRRFAREAVLTCIRANGDKISLYTPAQISCVGKHDDLQMAHCEGQGEHR